MMRHILGWLLVLGIALVLFAPGRAFASPPERSGRVTGSSVNVRSGPGTSYSVLTQVVKDAAVIVVEEQGDWLKIRLSDGSEGWVASKFLEITAATPADETKPAPSGEEEKPAKKAALSHEKSSGGGGGSAIGAIFKWTCFVGAGVTGYLAYKEHTDGNDAYDQYKKMFDANNALLSGFTADGAESKRKSSIDHDGKCNTYLIVSGSLFGAFLIQQLFLGGHHDQAQAPVDPVPPPLAFNPVKGEFRASLVLARF
jgi:hypothetical protein